MRVSAVVSYLWEGERKGRRVSWRIRKSRMLKEGRKEGKSAISKVSEREGRNEGRVPERNVVLDGVPRDRVASGGTWWQTTIRKDPRTATHKFTR